MKRIYFRAQLQREKQAREDAVKRQQELENKLQMYQQDMDKARKGELTMNQSFYKKISIKTSSPWISRFIRKYP